MMHGLCKQLVVAVVVLMMTATQAMSWEEIYNGHSNQDDDFVQVSVPGHKPRQDPIVQPSEHEARKEKAEEVVAMRKEEDKPRDQSHPKDNDDGSTVKGDKLEAGGESENVPFGPSLQGHPDTVKTSRHLLDMSRVEVYGGGDDDANHNGQEIDCNDSRFVDSVDCLFSTPADANLSKEGLKARQQLFDFMELSRQKRQSETDNNDGAMFDEGSGTGDIYQDSTSVANGTYRLEWSISFNVTNITETTQIDLEIQLWAFFSNITGFEQVNVTRLEIVNGTLVAMYEVVFSGQTVSGYGINEQDVIDSLNVTLINVTASYYNFIVIEGQTPLNPFDTSGFATAVGGLLTDICSSQNPCPNSYTSCNATGLDEGVCLHLCYIFQMDGVCEHGGTCELNENNTAFCSCTDNWTGDRCQEAVVSDSDELDEGEIIGAIVGAILVVIGIIGLCCWCIVCRKGTRNIHMTHYSDDVGGSDRFSNPSSKISTFVIDRPRISTSPFNAFNPGHSTSPYHTTVRAKATLFSDA